MAKSKKSELEDVSESVTSTIKKKVDAKKVEPIYFQCGCELLDLAVGGSKGVLGIPAGKFINIVGDKSAGKTFLSNEFIAWAHYNHGKKFRWVYDDCESGYSFDTESMYGFEIMPQDEKKRVNSENVEECYCNIAKFANELGKNECGIYVVDSLDGLTSYEDDERAEERKKQFEEGKGAKLKNGTYAMNKQKYLSKEFFPQLCSEIEKKNVLVIIISQIREKIDPMSFEKYNRSGGKAMDFYAHSVIWLAGTKKILRRETPVGNVVKAKTTKSKTPRPYRECFFNFLYDYGLDDVGTSVDYLFDLRTDKGELNKKANAIKWDGDNNFDKKSLKEFLEQFDLYEKFENSKYADMDGTDADNMFAFIQSKKDYKSKFNEKFGDTVTRDELITYIEENNLEDELRARVDQKWEDFEDSIRSNRKKKYYSKQLESVE